jgi:hypothetical protein
LPLQAIFSAEPGACRRGWKKRNPRNESEGLSTFVWGTFSV